MMNNEKNFLNNLTKRKFKATVEFLVILTRKKGSWQSARTHIEKVHH